jgi:hypothetical protein
VRFQAFHAPAGEFDRRDTQPAVCFAFTHLWTLAVIAFVGDLRVRREQREQIVGDCSLRLVIDICHTLFAFVPDNLDYGLRLA